VIIREAQCTERHLELYKIQTERFQSFILRNPSGIFNNPGWAGFKTREVAIYDENKLIAFSLFDVGFRAMASILCCYDKDYDHLSLGKATMLCELQYAKDQGISYYYPGYVLDEPTRMDYKLSLGNYEFMSREKTWTEHTQKPSYDSSAKNVKRIMSILSDLLHSFHIHHKIWVYPLFTLAISQTTKEGDWVAWPMFIELDNHPRIFITLDQYSGNVIVFIGKILKQLTIPTNVWPSSEFMDQEKFMLHPLEAEKILHPGLIQKNDNRLSIIARLLHLISTQKTIAPDYGTHSPS
jgi:arginine-tRNA-protein transferase